MGKSESSVDGLGRTAFACLLAYEVLRGAPWKEGQVPEVPGIQRRHEPETARVVS